jgi:RND family efflux transporter MFP subunit
MFTRIVAASLITVAVAGCEKPIPTNTAARPVRAVTIGCCAQGESVSLTGQVRAKDQVSIAFRIDGRMVERLVNVGDIVAPGQIVAKLDLQDQQHSLRTAQGNLDAAAARLSQGRSNFSRKQELFKGGWVPRAQFDDALEALQTAQAQVDSAQAQVHLAEDQLSYTVLYADAPGAVTAVGAEPGEVVHGGQMIVNVARDGGRDAVFDVPEELIRTGPRDPAVEIALTNDPNVKAGGRVREVAPQADAATRTFRVKVGIIDPQAAMRLGATVTGHLKLAAPPGVEIPPSALTEANGHAVVWVIDPKNQTVSQRDVDVLRHDAASVVIAQGLQTGDVVVTAGVQQLRPGQKVRLLGGA